MLWSKVLFSHSRFTEQEAFLTGLQNFTDEISGLGRVNSAAVKWIAAADPPQPFGSSFDHTVLFNRLDKVVAAAGFEPAHIPVQRADRYLVQPHKQHQNPLGNRQQSLDDPAQLVFLLSGFAAAISFLDVLIYFLSQLF